MWAGIVTIAMLQDSLQDSLLLCDKSDIDAMLIVNPFVNTDEILPGLGGGAEEDLCLMELS